MQGRVALVTGASRGVDRGVDGRQPRPLGEVGE
jgi:hypothetical protein